MKLYMVLIIIAVLATLSAILFPMTVGPVDYGTISGQPSNDYSQTDRLASQIYGNRLKGN
jgi:hypothetical protein